jgi:hypothetical protein
LVSEFQAVWVLLAQQLESTVSKYAKLDRLCGETNAVSNAMVFGRGSEFLLGCQKNWPLVFGSSYGGSWMGMCPDK